MTTATRLTSVVAVSTVLLACSSKPDPPNVTVTWSDVRQTIDGFGASSAFFGGIITDDTADMLFDAKKGIGLSLLRTMIGVPDDTQSDGVQPPIGADPKPSAPELVTAQQASVRGAKVWAAAWTPPPVWKTTNNKNGSGTGYASNRLKPDHYLDYALYLSRFVDLMAAANPSVPLFGLSPTNEPDYVPTWDGAQWTPDELTTFIGDHLGPTLSGTHPSVKIIAPETANCPACDAYVTPLLANADAAGYVSIIAAHGYGSPIGVYTKPRENGKSFWATEWSQENAAGDTPDPSMTSALDMAKRIHADMVNSDMNAWSWWAAYIENDGLNDNQRMNPALIQPDATKGAPYMFKRGYAFGNWSKFVRPGFRRIGAADDPIGDAGTASEVFVEAYRDDSHIAIIAVNPTDKPVARKFTLDGGTFGTVTPWVTSADDSLAAKRTINAGKSFTFTLPATSVVTFVNWDATAETPGQPNLGPPPAFRASVGLNCSAAVVPNNGGSGGVTDFTDWKGSVSKWGDLASLFGTTYTYAGPAGSSMAGTVDTTADNFHVTGSVTAGDYGGAGIGFSVCATVASFTQVQFTVAGSSPGCDMELQIKTFDQQPKTQNPPGSCDLSVGTCYNFPVVRRVAVPSATATTVVTPLSSFTNWSAANAAQVVGLQWQFTRNSTVVDAGTDADAGTGCPIDVTITGVKFLP
jgi:glucuronoarabinoxylan endo-1,4-beta-xylanase